MIIISEKDTEEYIVIERPITIENRELKVEVAYRLGKDKDGKQIIIPEPDSKLVVFFPTEKVTFLDFVIQGPYKTTQTVRIFLWTMSKIRKLLMRQHVLLLIAFLSLKI